jgi:tetratricopeptide (TPR) repeat protein
MKQLSAPAVDGLGPFWAHPSSRSGYFLAACDLSAHKKWRELSQLTAEWVGEEPYNPEAWMASGRAQLGLKRPREAAAAFQHALALDATHAEAIWELERLEVELDAPLIGN